MNIKYNKIIEFDKDLNMLDNFVIKFTSVLNQLNIDYVLVSGYVAILFGRNRSSEDVDIFIEKIDVELFDKLWLELNKEFECLNTNESKDAYQEYLLTGHAIRFAKKGSFIPNMEIKFPKMELDSWTLENRKEVKINKQVLFISPLELQIPFKLFLGSEKDIEDAKFLYNLFKDKINNDLLRDFTQKLKIEQTFRTLL